MFLNWQDGSVGKGTKSDNLNLEPTLWKERTASYKPLSDFSPCALMAYISPTPRQTNK